MTTITIETELDAPEVAWALMDRAGTLLRDFASTCFVQDRDDMTERGAPLVDRAEQLLDAAASVLPTAADARPFVASRAKVARYRELMAGAAFA